MKLHELIRRASEILTPKTDSFKNYALFACDDKGGFLRTRVCRLGDPLKDKYLNHGNNFLACFDREFNEKDYYLEDGSHTDMQMLLFYGSDDLSSDIEWARHVGCCYTYLLHTEDGTYKFKRYRQIKN